MDAKFLTSANKPDQLPQAASPEAVFVGRSNCGKSSLINAICQRQNLARTSQTPGRTQMANFFMLNGLVTLIDLPGYGFSATGKTNRQHWQELAEACVCRESVKHIFYLQDARRTLTAEDRDLVRYLCLNAPMTVVLTKADKAKQAEIQSNLASLKAAFKSSGIAFDRILAASAAKSRGIEELQGLVLGLGLPPDSDELDQ